MNGRSNRPRFRSIEGEIQGIPLRWKCYAGRVTDNQEKRNSDNPTVLWARYSEIAFIIPGAVVVGLLVGKLLDFWLHTHWLFLGGIIFGAIVGFVQTIRMVTRDKN